jgi:hypothetical protein
MVENPKTALMLHLDRQQKRIWDAALQSQSISIEDRSPEVDIVEMLKEIYQSAQPLPDLLIMDIGIKSSTSNSLQVVPVCQWCRSLDKPLKVLLLNSSSTQVKAYEEKWATGKCGAIAIVSKLNQATLISTMSLITDIWEREVDVQALEEVSFLLADIYAENLGIEVSKIRNAIASSAEPLPKVTEISSYRGAFTSSSMDDNGDTRIQAPIETVTEDEAPKPKVKVTTYRGVKVKKLEW